MILLTSDSTNIPDSFEGYQGLFLVLSNIFIIPAIYASIYKKAHLLTSFLSTTMIVSTLYHFCTAEFYCLANVHAMAQWDFIFAMGSVAVGLEFLLAYDAPRYKGTRILEQRLTFIVFFAIIVIRVLIDREAAATFFWIIGIAVFLIFLKLVFVDHFTVYTHDYNWIALIIGFLFILMGLGLFFVTGTSSYWWTHSLWHTLVFIGMFFFILGRRVEILACDTTLVVSQQLQLQEESVK